MLLSIQKAWEHLVNQVLLKGNLKSFVFSKVYVYMTVMIIEYFCGKVGSYSDCIFLENI